MYREGGRVRTLERWTGGRENQEGTVEDKRERERERERARK